MTSEERVRYLLEVIGAQQAEQAFKKQSAAILETDKAANQLSNELKANARLQEVMQRAAQRTAAAQEAQSATTRTLSTATAQAATASNAFAQNASRLTQAVGVFGQAANALAPEIGILGTTFSRASGLIQGASQSLGGFVGIAGGVAATALGILSSVLDESNKRLREFNEEVDKANEKANEDFFARMQRTDAASSAGAAALAKTYADRAALQSVGIVPGGLTPEQQADLAGVNAAEAAQSHLIGANIEGKGRTGPAPLNQTRADRLSESDALVRGLQRQADEAKRRADLFSKTKFDDEKMALAGAPVATKLNEEFANAAQKRADALADSALERDRKRFEQREEMAKQYHDTLRAAAQESWGMVGSAAGAAFAAIARGEKVTLKEILKSLGSQAIASGTMKLFEGAGMLAFGNPQGAALLKIGTAQIGFGLALAGAGAGGSGAAGAGGGSSGSRTAPTFVEPSRETGARHTQPVIVNNYMPTVTAPSHDDGKRIRKGVEQARRKGRL